MPSDQLRVKSGCPLWKKGGGERFGNAGFKEPLHQVETK